MSQSPSAYYCIDHWQEKEIVLERVFSQSSVDDVISLGFTIAGGNDLPIVKDFTHIIVVHIIENGLADRNRQLKLYDIILRINGIDCSNIEHQTAVEILKRSGKKVWLLIRRLTPQHMKTTELEHQSGKLGISIEGGIGSEYLKGDHGVFITHIPNQISKQLNVGDRLLEISSAKNTYDLRFVTHDEAKTRIGLACSDSRKVKLTVSSYIKKLIRNAQTSNNLCRDQCNPRTTKSESKSTKDKRVIPHQVQCDQPDYRNEETSILSNENGSTIITTRECQSKSSELTQSIGSPHKDRNEQELIQSFDYDDWRRYERHNKTHTTEYRAKSTVLSCTPPNADLQIHLNAAQKIGVLQFDRKNLKEIPPEICSLCGLRTLSLNGNEIQSLPDDLRNLVSLKNLFLRYNQIESLPSIIFTHRLSKLEILQLNGNRLRSLPASFSYLTALRQLNLSKNHFLTVPPAVLHLPNLQLLDLAANSIREIQDEIEFLEVDELVLSHNQISQISTNISKCKRLKILRLDNNNLRLRSIPTTLLTNSAVFQLSINGNFFEITQFQLLEGYDDYEKRYTANQRKKDATATVLLS